MMLTGSEIVKMREVGSVVIEPFDPAHVEVNSYGCHTADLLLEYRSDRIDPHGELEVVEHHIPPEGFVLYPNRFTSGRLPSRSAVSISPASFTPMCPRRPVAFSSRPVRRSVIPVRPSAGRWKSL